MSESNALLMRNTVLMLNLAVAQISLSMNDGDDSVSALSNGFTVIMKAMTNVLSHAEKINDDDPQKDLINNECLLVNQKIGEIVVAFQFYDKLSQRLEHVSHSLDSLSDVMGDEAQCAKPDTWIALQSFIRQKYTMREETEMFDAIIQGYTVAEALDMVANNQSSEEVEADDDVELF